LLGKTITQVLGTPGRKVQTLAQASFDAWIKYYRPDENTANATVSYYTKGALVALALDLTLRGSAGRGTLDGVMQRLWALERPITEADIRAAAAAEAGRSLDREFNAWVHGTSDLPLADLLAGFGINWLAGKPTAAQSLGLRLTERDGSLKVQAVMRDSAAEAAGFAAGDEWLALDNWRLRKTDDLPLLRDPARAQVALVARDQRLLSLKLAPQKAGAAGAVGLSLDTRADGQARQRRERWFEPAR
ncbi:MAG: peptidase M61, partial [Aquabacterium sp.]